MALYQNGVLISGSGNIPELTLAQYNALSVKPTYWVRTDLDYNDLDATNVAYDNAGSGLSATKVQGAIDEIQTEIGSTDISAIGDGTVTGAISDLDNNVSAKIKTVSCAPSASTSVDGINLGAVIFVSRNSASIMAIYMIDNGGIAVPMITPSHATMTYDYSNKRLTIVNGAEAGCFASILNPMGA